MNYELEAIPKFKKGEVLVLPINLHQYALLKVDGYDFRVDHETGFAGWVYSLLLEEEKIAYMWDKKFVEERLVRRSRLFAEESSQ